MSDDDGIQVWAPIEVVEGLLKRAEQAEAAIQRVRELIEPRPKDGHDPAVRWFPHVDAEAVLRALDGTG